jgi:hypothetical protein
VFWAALLYSSKNSRFWGTRLMRAIAPLFTRFRRPTRPVP